MSAAASVGPGRTVAARLLVLAKEPVPGRVKTRLTPPYAPDEAARLADAALADTLATAAQAVSRLALEGLAVEPLLVLHGRAWPGLDPRFRIVAQRGGGLDERLAAAFDDGSAGGPDRRRVPCVLIGMDTPQVSSEQLVDAVRLVASGTGSGTGSSDACFGPATDGGWWLLGLRRPDPRLLLGLPMSEPTTGAATLDRLRQAGLTVAGLPTLTDVDTASDAALVADLVPTGSRFAAVHDDLSRLVP